MPKITLRPDAAERLRDICGVPFNRHLGDHIGVSGSQASRILNRDCAPGSRFIAGVVWRVGLERAFKQVLQVTEDDGTPES